VVLQIRGIILHFVQDVHDEQSMINRIPIRPSTAV
jgi:hypothetical protein